MTLVKSQVSSHRKGKEVISAPPATRDVGEEVVYSELNLSNEEQVQRDPDSEYAPLIYPWYDIHPHFQKILSDYTPPLPSCVWLALCRQNTDISWAPLASSIPNLVIRQGTLLPVPIHFEFGSGTALDWKEWVDNKLSDTGFMGLLQRARCFEGHYFIPLFIQLLRPFQPSSLGPSVVYHHPYLLLLLR